MHNGANHCKMKVIRFLAQYTLTVVTKKYVVPSKSVKVCIKGQWDMCKFCVQADVLGFGVYFDWADGIRWSRWSNNDNRWSQDTETTSESH